MLIAISGSGGCGKSTLVAKLAELGYPVVTRKTSRSILADWGVALSDVNNNPELTLKFQDEILKRKIADDRAVRSVDGVAFTERSFLDLWTYALVAMGSNNSYSDWLDDYYRRCLVAQQTYDKVYYLTAGHFKPEHDGVRGSNNHYSRMVDIVMLDYFKQMTQPTRQCVIDTPSLADRMAILTSHNPL
jgi:predicted ATPase